MEGYVFHISQDPYLQDFIKTDLRLRAAAGRSCGNFSVVLSDQERSDRVYKLTIDPGTVAYLTEFQPRYPKFKPKVLFDHGVVCKTGAGAEVHFLEIERLSSVLWRPQNQKLQKRLMRFRRERILDSDARFPAKADGLRWLPKRLTTFFEELNDFARRNECCVDIHQRNFMERDDGTFVVADPVFHIPTYHRYVGPRSSFGTPILR